MFIPRGPVTNVFMLSYYLLQTDASSEVAHVERFIRDCCFVDLGV
jgi:hypothetical protein